MKTQMLRIAVITMTLLAALAATAQAPSGVLVNVPFGFVIGDHRLQPGRYAVTSMGGGILRISNTEVPANQMFFAVQSTYSAAPTDPKLVFHRYGDTYFLAQIWNGSDVGKEVPKSKEEKEILAARLKGSRSKSEVAVLRPER